MILIEEPDVGELKAMARVSGDPDFLKVWSWVEKNLALVPEIISSGRDTFFLTKVAGAATFATQLKEVVFGAEQKLEGGSV